MIHHKPALVGLLGDEEISARSRTTTHLVLQEVDSKGLYTADYDWSPYDDVGGTGGGWQAQLRDRGDELVADAVVGARGARASSTINTGSTNATAGDTILIGSVTYTFVAGQPTAAKEVRLGVTVTETVGHLERAVNAIEGEGTSWFAGDGPHPLVRAVTAGEDFDLETRDFGLHGNYLAVVATGTAVAWTTPTLSGGLGSRGIEIVWPGTDLDQPLRAVQRHNWDLFGFLADLEAVKLAGGPATYRSSVTRPYGA